MGLDISIKINDVELDSFNGRQAFGTLRDYMINAYNYEYGTDLVLNKNMIWQMIQHLLLTTMNSEPDYCLNPRMAHISALVQCYATINQTPNTIVTWECDW